MPLSDNQSPLDNYGQDGEFQGYCTGDTFGEMMNAFGECVPEYGTVSRSSANMGRTYENYETDRSVRSEYNRSDYDYFRRGERVPHDPVHVMELCQNSYEDVAIVRSVIDMMSDFTTQGIRLVHPNKNIENFHKNWAKTVGLHFVSERICNSLYTKANCPVKIRYGKVPVSIERDWRKSHAVKPDLKLSQIKTDHKVIPLDYHILNPSSIEVIGGELSAFVGRPIYGIKINMKFKSMFQKMERLAATQPDVHEMINAIPDSMKTAIRGGRSFIRIDQEKFEMLHYRKDSWKVWATPMLKSILSNLILLEKMHLADASALDGAISQIRLWRLGIYNEARPLESILPKQAAMNKLRSILHNVGNGVLDLVWGPELDFKESNSQVHNYLKPEKYTQVMNEIHAGLGVPGALTGSDSGGGGMTNNSISMKTLVERLEYGRKILVSFWEKELKIIQKAYGWRFPAKVVFDYRVLSDEAAEKKLMLDMWDRNMVSTEDILELSRRDPEMAALRVAREQRKIENGSMPQKASPYHNAEKEHDLRKLLLQGGGVCPSEVGLELEEKKEGEQCRTEQLEDTQIKLAEMNQVSQEKISQQKIKVTSPGGDGRPKNSTDKTKRKQKTVKPRTTGFVNLFMWGNDAQKAISKVFVPFFLENFDKKTMRELNKEETSKAEQLKFEVFSNIKPYSQITAELVYNVLGDGMLADSEMCDSLKALSLLFVEQHDRKPTLEEMRQMQSSAYALKFEEIDEEK